MIKNILCIVGLHNSKVIDTEFKYITEKNKPIGHFTVEFRKCQRCGAITIKHKNKVFYGN